MRHMPLFFGAALLGAGALAGGSTAQAQEEPFLRQSVPAPINAFELRVGGGYTQGFGLITPGVGIPSVAGAGVNGNLGLGWRVNPFWSVGVLGEYQQFNGENNEVARGFLGNLGVTLHAAPLTRGDPWVRLPGCRPRSFTASKSLKRSSDMTSVLARRSPSRRSSASTSTSSSGRTQTTRPADSPRLKWGASSRPA